MFNGRCYSFSQLSFSSLAVVAIAIIVFGWQLSINDQTFNRRVSLGFACYPWSRCTLADPAQCEQPRARAHPTHHYKQSFYPTGGLVMALSATHWR